MELNNTTLPARVMAQVERLQDCVVADADLLGELCDAETHLTREEVADVARRTVKVLQRRMQAEVISGTKLVQELRDLEKANSVKPHPYFGTRARHDYYTSMGISYNDLPPWHPLKTPPPKPVQPVLSTRTPNPAAAVVAAAGVFAGCLAFYWLVLG